MKAIITLIIDPDKDITEKRNYSPVSPVNLYVKTLKKILGNQIQQYLNIITHHD